ncbi:NERD domain-containing protein [Acidobacteriota bacterium]
MSSQCIPGIYPSGDLPLESPESERKVFEAIKNSIPKNWYVWHSLKIRTSNGKDAECDFVIADPAQGLLLIETKGGYLSKKEGQWHQNDRPLPQDPSSQVKRFRRLLRTKFHELEKTPPQISTSVCFPDTSFDSQPTQGDLDGRIIGSHHFPHLEIILPTLFNQDIPEHKKKSASSGWIKTIHDLWCESWIPESNLSLRAKDFEDRRIQLNKEQFCSLCSILENDKALILGSAGTGKTLLARELALKEADSGKRVLLLTFTRAVGVELKEIFTNTNVTASHIGSFIISLYQNKGIDLDVQYTPEFWNDTTLEACINAVPPEDEKWDTVIVDEGQDMGENEWLLIEECAKSTKRIWVFADSTQAFWEDKKIPENITTQSTKYRLNAPFRCPKGIQNLVNAYSGVDYEEESIHLALKRGELKILKSNKKDIHKNIGEEIKELISEGFPPNDIAIISLRGQGFQENIMHQKAINGHSIFKATDSEASSNIVVDTFLRFKGLERRAVIVTDLRYVTNKYQTRMNIAMSRAMGVLRIIGAEEEISKDAILERFC